MNNPLKDMTVTVITETADLAEMFHTVEGWLENDMFLSIDTETGSVHDLWAPLPGTGQGFCRLFQIGNALDSYVIDAQKWHGVVAEICDMVAASNRDIWFANFQYDLHVMKKEGWALPGMHQIHDVVIQHRLTRPHLKQHGLKAAAKSDLGVWAGFGQHEMKQAMRDNKWDWSTIPIDNPQYLMYAGLDTSLTCLLAENLEYHPFAVTETIYAYIAFGMEEKGMKVDLVQLAELHTEWKLRIFTLESTLISLGVDRPTSNRCVEAALRSMGFEPDVFTETGDARLDKAVLNTISHQQGSGSRLVAAAEAIIEHRRLSKWLTVYVKKLQTMAVDSRVHPTIRTMEARTGRSSVTDPPIQTIPKKAVTRNVFVADEGYELWAVDYDSQEARILAMVSEEPALIQLFNDGNGDIHSLFAAELDIERDVAKTVVYAKLFGAGNATLGAAMGGNESTGYMINRLVAAKFPKLDAWFKQVIEAGKQDGYVTLPSGRRLHCEPDEEYKLINYSIQGRGADVLKGAAVRLDRHNLSKFMVMVVHDEILFQFKKGQGQHFMPEICGIMEVNSGLVRLTVQAEGPFAKWGEKHEEKV